MSSEHGARAADSIQQHMVEYARRLTFENISPEAAHAAKAFTIDTLGVLVSGFCYEPCRKARNVAANMRCEGGATVVGSRMKTTLDMAAFVNATTARYTEANDVYARFKPGYSHGHPSDVIMPLLSVAEHANSSGREFIASVVLAYEVYMALCDVVRNHAFDTTTFGCAAIALAAGKLLGLNDGQIAHAVSMAIVPNNILNQVRQSHITMWKAVAAGKAGQAGVFAAMLAQAGMEGPHLPFEGKAGWCAHVAKEKLALELRGGAGAQFLIVDSRIKPRPARALTMGSIMAAEKLTGRVGAIENVRSVTVDVTKQAARGTGEHHWHPDSRETADHSIPYVVAASLVNGTITPRSFDDGLLWNPQLRALMPKIDIVVNDEYTRAFEGTPQQYRARVTVVTQSGESLSAESGGDSDDLAAPKSDEQIAAKFRGCAEDMLGAGRSNALLDRLWNLHGVATIAELPPQFVLV